MLNYAPMPESGAARSLRDQFVALGFDPLQLMSFFRRRVELLLGVTVAIFVAVVLYVAQVTPLYTASADVQIDTRTKAAIDIGQVMSGLSTDSSSVDTEVRILTSRSLAERVVKKLNLNADPEFNPALQVKPGLATRLGLKTAPPPPPKSAVASPAAVETAVSILLGGLHVQRAGLTYIITLSYTSPDPKKAALIANTYADLYLDDQLEVKYEQARRVSEWLSGRLVSLRQEVEQADAQVQMYKITNNLMSAQGSTLAEAEVSTLNQQIAAANADRAEKLARLQAARAQIQRGGGGADVGAALGSGTISSLRAQEAATSREVAELSTKYGPKYEDLIKAQGRLKDIQAQIASEIQRIMSNLEAEVQVANQRAASLADSQGAARGGLVSNSRAQVGLLELERKAEASRAIYESFLNRSKETSSQQGIQQPDARVVSRAQVPGGPSFPNMKLALLFGAAIALLCGLGAIVLAELLDTGIATGEEVERRFGLPHAASLPKLKLRKEGAAGSTPQDFLVDNPFSVFAEAFRNLRAFLLLSVESGGTAPKSIAICSALPSEGKTTTAFCMMRTLALSGARTVLVDADLRRRGVSKLVQAGDVGVVEVLEDLKLLDKALVADGRTTGMVLPVVGDITTSEDMFSAEKLGALIQALEKRFDFILIDTPPVLALAEARLVASKVDRVVFLVQWRRTPAKAIENAISSLVKAGAKLAGVCLTQVDLRRQTNEGYGDSYYYYNSYKNYYAQ